MLIYQQIAVFAQNAVGNVGYYTLVSYTEEPSHWPLQPGHKIFHSLSLFPQLFTPLLLTWCGKVQKLPTKVGTIFLFSSFMSCVVMTIKTPLHSKVQIRGHASNTPVYDLCHSSSPLYCTFNCCPQDLHHRFQTDSRIYSGYPYPTKQVWF